MVHDDRTTIIQGCIDRLRAGDDSARAALLEHAMGRLTRLARKMLRSYPAVGRWEETDDVVQNALIRLDRALKAVAPPTVADFFRFAAAQVRRELIDLGRRHAGSEGLSAQHAAPVRADDRTEPASSPDEPQDTTHDPGRLAVWTEFHRRIETLTEADREVFDLLWYQGRTQAEAAKVLGVSERTVHRSWVAARLNLHRALGGHQPEF
jgi:RNA polymerase sigma-70 factor (ECF subfamily)